LFVSLSRVKVVKLFATWQHLATSGEGLIVSTPIHLFTIETLD